MKYLKNIVFAVIIYIYIFNPVFIAVGIGSIKFLLLLALVYAINHQGTVKKYFAHYKEPSILFFILLSYVLLIIIINKGNAINAPYSMFLWWIESFFIPIYLIENFFEKKNNIKVIPYVLNVGFVASLISIFLLLNPNLNEYVLGGLIELPYENNLGRWERCFGIAEGLTSSYGIIQGIFASIALLLFDRKHKVYLFYFLTMSIATIINARTGMIPIILAIIFKLHYSIKQHNYLFPIVLVFVAFIVIKLITYTGDGLVYTLDYATIFFTASYEYFVKGEASDYYGSIDTFLQIPSTLFGVIFGEGRTLFGAEINSSDISFVNQIFTGGLFFLVGLIIHQFLLYKKIFMYSWQKYIPLLLISTAFIINFKGVPFCTSESFSRFVMLVYFIIVHNRINKSRIQFI